MLKGEENFSYFSLPSTYQKLAWLNTTIATFEGEGDTTETASKISEWK
jgi:hypothetical protein